MPERDEASPEIGDREGESSVFTIGHSNHPPERFTGLLMMHGIEVVADVRSHPRSRHAPHFNAGAVEAALSRCGIGYVFFGVELGGRPTAGNLYDERGRVDYRLVARSTPFLDGISRLENEISVRRVALLCSEEDPAGCHRRLLVGRVLEERGVSMRHIRGNGGVHTESETDGGQPVLFPQLEVGPRKSLRSVSPKKRRPSSSGR